MSPTDLAETLATGATRRAVVKTGAKLAYAAPLVAASFKMRTLGASAQILSDVVGGTCTGDFVCGVTAAPPCGSNAFGTCFCFAGVEIGGGLGFCGSNETCANLQDCVTTADCTLPNRVCAPSTCCGRNVCIEQCPQSSDVGITATDGAPRPAG